MRNLVVNCIGNGEVALVHLHYDFASDRFYIAELVAEPDEMVHRRVNREVLSAGDHIELDEVLRFPMLEWNMEAVEGLALAYLNRQNEARVKLHEEWAAELTE